MTGWSSPIPFSEISLNAKFHSNRPGASELRYKFFIFRPIWFSPRYHKIYTIHNDEIPSCDSTVDDDDILDNEARWSPIQSFSIYFRPTKQLNTQGWPVKYFQPP